MWKEIVTTSYFDDLLVKPRPPPKNPHLWAKTKTPWDFFKSVFAPYKWDTSEILMKCFEFDWSCSKIPNLVKDEEDWKQFKEILWKHYRIIWEAYKFFSAI